ncbi:MULTISPECIES: hypothetical protein [Actinokineospora]|uniref:Secreted protein n=1 Tax=Actinokineospora fastidiosa TaxID=1816 RepID=A0A918GTS4_9PSEU|nr:MULTISPECIES: hypothetical protein [Actinokineospora]UVS81526.1 hypothetical protein Actkin_05284 [Actinokineospora sp. UTMC 2448]GGS57472.1 hypothetical protein GCM10010171_60520 [Actinokineospora fastidiosa]
MLKKAGIVTSAVAGLMMIGGTAFACPGMCDDDWDGPSTIDRDDNIEQVGLVNVDDVDILENVNIPICATNNNIAVGLVAVAANLLNPTEFDRCVEGTIWTGDEVSD